VIRRSVSYAPEAQSDLFGLYDQIADAASPVVALRYVQRIERWLDGFETASERGVLRDDIRSGLRIVGFERRVTVAFTVLQNTVLIQRVFYGGQDWATAWREP
jgi:toxin ParE1/3/4